MSEEQLSKEVVTGETTPQGATEIPNGINIPVGNTNAQEVKEEKILGKFDNQEALVKAYQELESKLGSNPQDDIQKNEEPASTGTDEQSKASLDISQYTKEFNENGELSEASYKKLQEEGYDREIVDAYIQGQAALGEKWATQVKGLVGSEEDYSNLTKWAGQGGVDENFIKQYDEAMQSMDINKATMAVEALKNLYSKANSEPNLLDGNVGSGSSGDVYESWAQLTVDLNSDAYHKDPAERERVQQKLSRSKNL